MKFTNYMTHMDYIYTVYQERSFTRAAEKLYISQPALSLTIKKVENEIGSPIFERSGKEVSLTPIGERYIKAIEEIMRIQTRLSVEIDDILNLRNGKISIGSTTFFASRILPGILKKFKDKYPDIEISIVVSESNELEGKLEENEVDIVIDNANVFLEGCKYIPLLDERILIAVPRELAINNELKGYEVSKEQIEKGTLDFDKVKKVDASLLNSEEFVLLKRGNKLRQLATRIFDECKVIPNVSMEFDRLSVAINYAAAGFGICFVTDTAIRFGQDTGNMNIYVPDTEFSHLVLYVIHKKNRHLSSTVREFINYIK